MHIKCQFVFLLSLGISQVNLAHLMWVLFGTVFYLILMSVKLNFDRAVTHECTLILWEMIEYFLKVVARSLFGGTLLFGVAWRYGHIVRDV